MHHAVDDCRRAKHPLRVSCAPTFAARWLVPRLATYHSLPGANPIVLDTSQAISPAGAFDIAIRNGNGPWPGYSSVRLLAEQGTPMISPKWWPDTTPVSVKRLLKVPLIPDPRWSEWFKLAGVPNAKPQFVATRFPKYELEAQAAVQGVGAALLSPVLYAGVRSQGLLVAPFSMGGGRPGQLLVALDQ
jgi:LysR family glycine cleavage system transcriptional activator